MVAVEEHAAMQGLWATMVDAANTVAPSREELEREMREVMEAAVGMFAQALDSAFGIRVASKRFSRLANLCVAGPPDAASLFAPRKSPRRSMASRRRRRPTNVKATPVAPKLPARFQPAKNARLPALPEDLLLRTLLFLDLASLNAASLVSRTLRHGTAHPCIWTELVLQRLFPRGAALRAAWRPAAFHASAGRVPTRHWNYLRRLALTARPFPEMPAAAKIGEGKGWIPEGIRRTTFDTYQFVQQVGVANRCIRSRDPLPKPPTPRQEELFLRAVEITGARSLEPLRERLRRWLGPPQPFVSPYALAATDQGLELSIAPRLVSYYEVTLLPLPRIAGPGLLGQRVPETPPCVAVGLSTRKFRPFSGRMGRMPGWDAHSYGYHSDDGGFFHDRGVMECALGDGYGPGDTVGCGVDYTPGAHTGGRIFFTLNGRLVSFVKAVAVDVDLYPTVGVDSNAPFRLNFGHQPFAYDLQAHAARATADAVEQDFMRFPKRALGQRGQARPEGIETLRNTLVKSFHVRTEAVN